MLPLGGRFYISAVCSFLTFGALHHSHHNLAIKIATFGWLEPSMRAHVLTHFDFWTLWVLRYLCPCMEPLVNILLSSLAPRWTFSSVRSSNFFVCWVFSPKWLGLWKKNLELFLGLSKRSRGLTLSPLNVLVLSRCEIMRTYLLALKCKRSVLCDIFFFAKLFMHASIMRRVVVLKQRSI